MTQCYFEGGYQETPVYLLGELGYGHKLQGPCLIIDSNRWAEAWLGVAMGVRAGATAARARVISGVLAEGSLAQGYGNMKDSGVPLWLVCPPAWGCGVPIWDAGSGLAPAASYAPTLSTILVEPGCQAEVTETGDIRISVGAEAPSTVGAQLDPIHLSIFSHRFMSIAGERPCPLRGGGGRAYQAGRGTGPVAGGRAVRRKAEYDPGEGCTAWSWCWDGQPPCTSGPWAVRVPNSHQQPWDLWAGSRLGTANLSVQGRAGYVLGALSPVPQCQLLTVLGKLEARCGVPGPW